MLNRQLAFDTAINGVLAQNALCRSPTLGCMYYDTATGNRCAAGHLYTEDQAKHIQEEMSTRAIPFVLDNVPLPEALGRPNSFDSSFLRHLQLVHDEAYDIDQFKEFAQQFAKQYSLNMEIQDA